MKEILVNSAAKVDDNFTAAIMRKVGGTTINPQHLQPLVSPGWVKVFVFAFGALLSFFLFLCMVYTINDLPLSSWVKAIEVPDINYFRLGTFLLIFWLVYIVNAMLQKRWSHQKPFLEKHK